MQKIFITVGLPGSGKTKWAKEYIKKHPQTLIVSRDDFRTSLHGGKYVFDEKLENLIGETSDFLIENLVEKGFNIIIDETNGNIYRRLFLIKTIREHAEINNKKVKIIAIVFNNKNNLKNRMKEPRGYSKEKWKTIINKMKKNWHNVNKKEGFDKIIYIS